MFLNLNFFRGAYFIPPHPSLCGSTAVHTRNPSFAITRFHCWKVGRQKPVDLNPNRLLMEIYFKIKIYDLKVILF